jgi:serine/threonine-protein kinase
MNVAENERGTPEQEGFPAKIGNFDVEAQIGDGALATVFLANQGLLERKVVLKVLRAELVGSPIGASRFLAQARVASRVTNPHVPTILEIGELPDGRAFYSMEWIRGLSLTQIMEAEPRLPVARVVHIVRGLGDALAAAHERGIIHRDLRPSNVRMQPEVDDPDFVKLLGFGASPSEESADCIFRSPEQICGADAQVDARTDVFSLAVIAYHLLAGAPPFAAQTRGELLLQHMSREPRSLRDHDASLPATLADVVHQALNKDPSARPSLREFLDALVEPPTENNDAWFDREIAEAPHAAEPPKRLARYVPIAAGVLVGLVSLALLLHRGERSSATPSGPTPAAPAVAVKREEPAPRPVTTLPSGWSDVDFGAKLDRAQATKARVASPSPRPLARAKAEDTPKPTVKTNSEAKQMLAYPE